MVGSARRLRASSCDAGPGLFVTILVTVLLFNLIAGLAGSVDLRALRAQMQRKRGIACGLLCQFILMPLIGFLVVTIGEPEQHVGLMILILCSSSGGAYSNWWCSLFNADLALSIAMTAVSTLLSGVMMPINLTVYINLSGDHGDIDVPWADIARSLAIVLVAIIAGVLTSTRFPKAKYWMNLAGNVSGVFMIVMSFLASSLKRKGEDDVEPTPLWGHEASFYLVVVMPFFFSVLASLVFSSLSCLHLDRPQRVAIVVEVSYQNIGIAAAVAVAAFCGSPRLLADAAAVPVLYGATEAVFLAVFCLIMWKLGWTFSPKEATLCASIVGNFQPSHAEEPKFVKDSGEADDLEVGTKVGVSESSGSTLASSPQGDSGAASESSVVTATVVGRFDGSLR